MKRLLTLDLKDYTDDMPAVEKHTVRAIIFRGGKLAAQQSGEGEYKLPGGVSENGEDFADTLLREVREEMGLLVRRGSILPIGDILEVRRDVMSPEQKYICRCSFFACEVEDETVETEMTESEIAKGFHPVWEYPEKIYSVNDAMLHETWRRRDTEFVRMLIQGEIELP